MNNRFEAAASAYGAIERNFSISETLVHPGSGANNSEPLETLLPGTQVFFSYILYMSISLNGDFADAVMHLNNYSVRPFLVYHTCQHEVWTRKGGVLETFEQMASSLGRKWQ